MRLSFGNPAANAWGRSFLRHLQTELSSIVCQESQDVLTRTRVAAQALFDSRVAGGMSPTEAAHDVARSFAPMQRLQGRIVQSRKLGMRLLLAPIWQQLGIHEALKDFARAHRLRAFDLERLLFGLVTNRIVDPMSKRAANEWLQEDAYFPEAEGWEVQHYYRALDLLSARA